MVFGKEKLGEVLATFNDDEISFEEPNLVLDKLKSFIKASSEKRLLIALKKMHETHIDRVCKKGPTCGYITPKVLGVIFDRGNYKVNVFINPKYLIDQQSIPAKYLKDSTSGFSSLNLFNMVESKENKNTQALLLHNDSYLSHGNWHLNYKGSYTQSSNESQAPPYIFNDIDLNWRHHQYYVSVGLQDTPGTLIIPSFKMLGGSFTSNNHLLINRTEQIATPIEVNILVPSYVNVYRNQELIDIQYFPPGNYFLNTTSFPNGAYNLKLVTSTLGGKELTQYVYFVKTPALPLLTVPNYYFSYGQIVQSSGESVIPESDHTHFFMVQAKQRLAKSLGTRESVIDINNDEVFGELALMTQFPLVSVNISGAVSNFGDYAASFSVLGHYNGVNLNTFFREVWVTEDSGRYISQYIEDTQDSNSEIGSSVSYQWHNFLFSDSLTVSHVDGENYKSMSASIEKGFQLNAHNHLSFLMSFTHSPSEKTLSMQLQWTFDNLDGWSSSIQSDNQYALGQFDGTNSNHLKLDLDRASTMGAVHYDAGLEALMTETGRYYSQSLRAKSTRLAGQEQVSASKIDHNQESISHSVKLSTTLAYSPQALWDFSSSNKLSGVLVKVHSSEKSQYSIYVDGKQVSTINNGQSLFVPLTAYREHNIQIQSNELTLNVPNNDINVVLYPGNVESVYRETKKSLLLMGNFVDGKNHPLPYYQVVGGTETTETDEAGFAQVDILLGSPLKLIDASGHECEVNTTHIEAEGGVAFEDRILCLAIKA
ncbi:TcfC E-set like domain-containing protein [Vibrio sp. S4M6]|uniref:TcfC E-set like domain-containing protein n=1 Tax=Vibrio sinus TaxID=2946865 RepID=UPI00202A214A|nr:TcfC E-set like domain-containing protein [Vibrio sinus]MCL9780636.1 TcfC E-set like domain-containing protein [Vibrio sinus]